MFSDVGVDGRMASRGLPFDKLRVTTNLNQLKVIALVSCHPEPVGDA